MDERSYGITIIIFNGDFRLLTCSIRDFPVNKILTQTLMNKCNQTVRRFEVTKEIEKETMNIDKENEEIHIASQPVLLAPELSLRGIVIKGKPFQLSMK